VAELAGDDAGPAMRHLAQAEASLATAIGGRGAAAPGPWRRRGAGGEAPRSGSGRGREREWEDLPAKTKSPGIFYRKKPAAGVGKEKEPGDAGSG
jgi:hypothetical protein